MELAGKVIVITGAARGIGQAMARRFAAEKPQAILPVDLLPVEGGEQADVTVEADVQRVLRGVKERYGRVDLVCSNAGVLVEGGVEVADTEWERLWRVNVLSHLYVAREMAAQGGGYLLMTVSAAGLLTAPGSAPYAVTKHAALGLAEWLAVEYADRGFQVSCLCPQFVMTDMVLGVEGPFRNWMVGEAISVDVVAEAVVAGLRDERFLILPHPEVQEYFQRKASDYDRWIRGMRRMLSRVVTAPEL